MDKKASAEPEREDVTVTPETVTMSIRASDPKVSIGERVDELAHITQLLVQHVNEDRASLTETRKERKGDRKENRKWRWITLAVTLAVAIIVPILIRVFFH